jgi:hypothetical protein
LNEPQSQTLEKPTTIGTTILTAPPRTLFLKAVVALIPPSPLSPSPAFLTDRRGRGQQQQPPWKEWEGRGKDQEPPCKGEAESKVACDAVEVAKARGRASERSINHSGSERAPKSSTTRSETKEGEQSNKKKGRW